MEDLSPDPCEIVQLWTLGREPDREMLHEAFPEATSLSEAIGCALSEWAKLTGREFIGNPQPPWATIAEEYSRTPKLKKTALLEKWRETLMGPPWCKDLTVEWIRRQASDRIREARKLNEHR